jgi:hypothetical protein
MLDPASTPIVKMVGGSHTSKYRFADFEVYPEVSSSTYTDQPLPEKMPTEAPVDLIQKFRRTINPQVFGLFEYPPEGSWSEDLWRLLMLLFEAGMEQAEVLHVANAAACNKYKRDGHPLEYLWHDVCRAYGRHVENLRVMSPQKALLSELLTDDELRDAERLTSYVERYVEWATGLGDAAIQYHQASAFIQLSAIMAGRVQLPTSFGTLIPNLWFMILGDTTLTRKTTAMDLAMDLLDDVDSEALLATDGSFEGLMQSLATRPGRASIFLRDEFSGLLEMMTKRDYYAGMAEVLTKLYDGKVQKRLLKRETIEVREPVLIIFAGGIRSKIQSLLTFEHIASGFIPRFVFITALSDATRIQKIGPPQERDMSNKLALTNDLRDMIAFYHMVEGNSTKKYTANLTPGAWARYNHFEATMLQDGLNSDHPDLMTPTFDRLSKSTLKAAVLLAASNKPDEQVTVREEDIIHAIRYAITWRGYACEVIDGIGRSAAEREVDKILQAVQRAPGVSRSQLMQRYHLLARNADAIFDTLLQRGQIISTRMGAARVYHPVNHGSGRGHS